MKLYFQSFIVCFSWLYCGVFKTPVLNNKLVEPVLKKSCSYFEIISTILFIYVSILLFCDIAAAFGHLTMHTTCNYSCLNWIIDVSNRCKGGFCVFLSSFRPLCRCRNYLWWQCWLHWSSWNGALLSVQIRIFRWRF